MKIIVKGIKGNIVYYSTIYGSSKAKWSGENPILNQEYFVEMEIEDLFSEGVNIVNAEKSEYKIDLIDEKAIFTGVLETIEPDGYAILRMEENIIPIEIKEGVFNANDFVRITIEDISMYPCDY